MVINKLQNTNINRQKLKRFLCIMGKMDEKIKKAIITVAMKQLYVIAILNTGRLIFMEPVL